MTPGGRIVVAAIGCVLLALAAGVVYMYPARQPHKPLLAWKDAAVVARGRVLYADHCAGCHGAKGEGQTVAGLAATDGPLAPPHDSTGHTWQHPDFALVQLTKSGVASVACLPLDENAMPKFADALTDREILDILSYIKSSWPADTIAEQEKVNRLYRSHNDAMWDMLKLGGTS
ncbi:MAG: cytochrome c [Rhizobiaceae bacterium]